MNPNMIHSSVGASTGVASSLPPSLSSDIVGVVAGFLPPDTFHQRPLMLVSHAWYQGVVEQDGMHPKPDIFWPWDALRQRQPRKLRLPSNCKGERVEQLAHHYYAKDVHELNLEECRKVTNDTMLSIAKFSQLTALNLKHTDVGDDGMRHVVQLRDTLTSLNLYNTYVTDNGMEFVGQLYHLTHLTFGSIDVTDAGLRHVESLSRLQLLDISDSMEITDAGMDSVAKLTSLTWLDLLCTRVGAAGVALIIKSLRKLTYFNLDSDGCRPEPQLVDEDALLPLTTLKSYQVTSASGAKQLEKLTDLIELDIDVAASHKVMQSVSKLRKLRSLDLGLAFVDVPDKSLALISSLENLISLRLGTALTHSAAKHVAQLTKLTDLAINGTVEVGALEHLSALKHLSLLHLNCQVLNDNVKDLPLLANLKSLELFFFRDLTDEGMQYVSQHKNLKSLEITMSDVGDLGMQHLTRLTSLECLRIQSSDNTTEAGMKCIGCMKGLTSLAIDGESVTDEVLASYTNLKHLRSLKLEGCDNITDSGVKCLEHLTSLKRLEMFNCEDVTNIGLRCLHKLPMLTSVNAFGCSVTDEVDIWQ